MDDNENVLGTTLSVLRSPLAERTIGKVGCDSCHGGQEAIEYLQGPKGRSVDVLVLDREMPRADGYAVAKIAKSLFPNVPIIMTTGSPEADWAIKMEEYGLNAYMAKPYAAMALIDAVKQCISFPV